MEKITIGDYVFYKNNAECCEIYIDREDGTAWVDLYFVTKNHPEAINKVGVDIRYFMNIDIRYVETGLLNPKPTIEHITVDESAVHFFFDDDHIPKNEFRLLIRNALAKFKRSIIIDLNKELRAMYVGYELTNDDF